MYSSNRTTLPTRPAINRNIPVPFVHGIFDRRHTPCSDLRSSLTPSDVMVYDAQTMKLIRLESPSGEIIERY